MPGSLKEETALLLEDYFQHRAGGAALPPSATAAELRRAAAELERRERPFFRSCAPLARAEPREAAALLRKVAAQLEAEGGLNWGRLLALVVFTGTLAAALAESGCEEGPSRLAAALATVPERAERGRLSLYRDLVGEYVRTTEMDPLELATVLAAMVVGDEGPGVGIEDEELPRQKFTDREDRGQRGDRPGRSQGVPQAEHGYTQYRIGVGHTHGAKPPSIVGAITGEGGLNGKDIGKISIFPSFSLVQIRGSLGPEQLERIGQARVGGRELRISPDRGPGGGRSDSRGGDRPFRKDRDHGGKKPFRRDRDGESSRPGSRFETKRKGPRRHDG